MLRFHKTYFILFLLLFTIEVLIALFMHDKFIRPYAGDFLVVIMVYCFVMAWLRAPVRTVAVAVLLFACTIETLQYFNIVHRLGLQHSRLANIVIGNHFAWEDIIAYTLGILFVVWIEYKRSPSPAQV